MTLCVLPSRIKSEMLFCEKIKITIVEGLRKSTKAQHPPQHNAITDEQNYRSDSKRYSKGDLDSLSCVSSLLCLPEQAENFHRIQRIFYITIPKITFTRRKNCTINVTLSFTCRNSLRLRTPPILQAEAETELEWAALGEIQLSSFR